MAELVEIRVLVAADDMAHGELLLGALSDTLDALVGADRYGAVLFEGINPNGTEVPEGFAPVEDDDEIEGVPV